MRQRKHGKGGKRGRQRRIKEISERWMGEREMEKKRETEGVMTPVMLLTLFSLQESDRNELNVFFLYILPYNYGSVFRLVCTHFLSNKVGIVFLLNVLNVWLSYKVFLRLQVCTEASVCICPSLIADVNQISNGCVTK